MESHSPGTSTYETIEECRSNANVHRHDLELQDRRCEWPSPGKAHTKGRRRFCDRRNPFAGTKTQCNGTTAEIALTSVGVSKRRLARPLADAVCLSKWKKADEFWSQSGSYKINIA